MSTAATNNPTCCGIPESVSIIPNIEAPNSKNKILADVAVVAPNEQAKCLMFVLFKNIENIIAMAVPVAPASVGVKIPV